MASGDPQQEPLSARELEIATAYAGGANYREIAEQLNIAPSTVRTHLTNIYRKCGVSNKIALARALKDITLKKPPQRPLPVYAMGALVLALVVVLASTLAPRRDAAPADTTHEIRAIGLVALPPTLTYDLTTDLTQFINVVVIHTQIPPETEQRRVAAQTIGAQLNLPVLLMSEPRALELILRLRDTRDGAVILEKRFLHTRSNDQEIRNEIVADIAKIMGRLRNSVTEASCVNIDDRVDSCADGIPGPR